MVPFKGPSRTIDFKEFELTNKRRRAAFAVSIMIPKRSMVAFHSFTRTLTLCGAFPAGTAGPSGVRGTQWCSLKLSKNNEVTKQITATTAATSRMDVHATSRSSSDHVGGLCTRPLDVTPGLGLPSGCSARFCSNMTSAQAERSTLQTPRTPTGKRTKEQLNATKLMPVMIASVGPNPGHLIFSKAGIVGPEKALPSGL